MAALVAEVPKAKLAGSIFKLLSLPFRRRSIQVCGHLSPITDQGAGVTLRLEGAGMDSESSIALWEHTFDPEPGGQGAARWLRLVPAATVWVRRQLAAKAWPETELDPDGWWPDALFQSAVQWQAQGNWSRAEALYADALERNPDLLPAAHNLSVIEIREDPKASGQYARARSRLLWIQKSFKRNPELEERWPMVATGYLYTLALSHVYEAKGERTGLLEARKIMRELVGTLATWISEERPAPGAQSFSPAEIAEMKSTVTPSVVVLASLTARCDPELADEAIDRLVAGETPPLEPLPKSQWIELDELCRDVCTLKPGELIDGYVLAHTAPWRRTHYNLACYYSTLATLAEGDERKNPCFDIALLALDNGLEGGYLIEWADKDPSLKPLRLAHEAKFKKILKRHKIDPHPEPKEDEKPTPTGKSTDDKNLLDFLAGLFPGQ